MHAIPNVSGAERRDKAPSEATFRGAEFLSYDLTQTGGEPIVSTQDAISLYFKTRQPNGLLFYTGHEADYLNLAVRDGGLSLTMGLGNGKQEMHIKPSKTRFDDHQWHKLTVRRRIQEVEFSADTLRLNLIDLARTGSKLITVTGRLEYACTATDSADPVTFSTKDAHLVSE
ncbi:jg15939 [Pararge aegeria aegeria]|uniref:Jg15939 protein n=1 Tax=Pararge aegeria aegeria TaxID=348720 RepID=A0A8S4RZM5_9NEOP|nr:jg15939 [Pararge aegeria aegeria]